MTVDSNTNADGDGADRSDRPAGDAGEEFHETSWSATLEEPRHADDPDAVRDEALDAVERTAAGVHVNLVTHGDLGHPEEYLYPALAERFGGDAEWEFVDRCGCGGYVTRVTR